MMKGLEEWEERERERERESREEERVRERGSKNYLVHKNFS